MDEKVFETEIKKIVEISKEYGAEKIILFGSCLKDIKAANDIDIAVAGVKPERFFEMYGKILSEIFTDMDLIPLEYTREHFSKRIFEQGKLLYAK